MVLKSDQSCTFPSIILLLYHFQKSEGQLFDQVAKDVQNVFKF